MTPIIKELYADNGAHSHWQVIEVDTGAVLIADIESVVNLQAQEPLNPVDAKKPCRFHSRHFKSIYDYCPWCGDKLRATD